MKRESRGSVRFGAFEFDLDRLVLRQDVSPVRLQPQPSRVLALLLAQPGRLVTREELQETVWAGRVVEFDAGLNFSIRQIRKVLGDNAGDPEFIETVPRRGYRFIASVSAAVPPGEASGDGSRRRLVLSAVAVTLALVGWAVFGRGPDAGRAQPSPTEIRLAILPFAELEEDAPGFYARGLTEDLITELANLSPDRLRVIAPTSVRRFSTGSEDAVEVGAQLGVEYLVRGAIRTMADVRRITVRIA